MSFKRQVLIDERVYGYHEATMVAVESVGDTVFVSSWVDESDVGVPSISPKISAIHMPDTEGSARQALIDAEEWAVSSGYFPVYENEAQAALDEVLPILTDEQAEQVVDAFPAWKAGAEYAAGYRVRYSNLLYRCLIAHTSQEGWEPSVAVSLWARIGGGDIPEWVQPTSANPYMAGDQVRHNGKTWESLIDNNVWEPGTAGTENLWREL